MVTHVDPASREPIIDTAHSPKHPHRNAAAKVGHAPGGGDLEDSVDSVVDSARDSAAAEQAERTAAVGPAPLSRRRMGVLFAAAATVYLLDMVTKYLAVRYLTGHDPVPVVDGLLRLRLVRNPGAAFGIGVNMTIVFTLVAMVVVGVILRMARRLYSVPWAIAFGLLLGGALGNLTDRVFRPPAVLRGHVVDFLELPYWPVFNIADSAIVIGGCLMVVLSFRGLQPDGRVSRD